MKLKRFEIHSPDFWEMDALLVDNKRHTTYYFEFPVGDEPTLKTAYQFLREEPKIPLELLDALIIEISALDV